MSTLPVSPMVPIPDGASQAQNLTSSALNGERILFLSSHTTRGGTMDYIFTLRPRLQRLGALVPVVALTRGGEHDPREIEALTPGGGFGPWRYVCSMVRFFGVVRRQRPDLVVGVMPLANVLAGLAGLFGLTIAVATHHNPCETHNRWLRLADRMLGSAGAYGRIVCVSEAVRASFARHPAAYRRCLEVIGNGVAPAGEPGGRTATRQRFGLPFEGTLVLAVGRLSPVKNVLRVIAALAGIDGAWLVLAGDGPIRDEAVALVRTLGLTERVFFLGVVGKQDVTDLLHACDVFVQASLYEGHSLALLEAIRAQSVMVVSAVPAQVEAVRLPDGSSAALLCDPESESGIADALRIAAFDSGQRQHLRSQTRMLAAAVQTEEAMFGSYAAVFSRLLVQR